MRKSVRLSQNFLRNDKLVEELISASSINATDLVLDIGAGNGSITAVLARRAKKVIAIEPDTRLAADLQTKFSNAANVQIVVQDFLTFDSPRAPYKVFANIPFNKTSDIVRKLLDTPMPPSDSYLLLQREAAQKFAGGAGNESLFSILHKPWFHMEITHAFKASDFYPSPKVSVVLLHCSQRINPLVVIDEAAMYRDFVSYVFNHANPNIAQSLPKLFSVIALGNLETQLGARLVSAKPSQLTTADWFVLFDVFHAAATPSQRALIAGTANKLHTEAKQIEKHHRTRVSKNWLNESRKS